MIDLRKWQLDFAKWQNDNFGRCNPDDMIIGMTEELGELAHAYLKSKQGIRGITPIIANDLISDAFGDIIVFGMQLLSALNINAEYALEQTMREAIKRKWKNE